MPLSVAIVLLTGSLLLVSILFNFLEPDILLLQHVTFFLAFWASSFVSFITVLLTITFPEMEDFSTFGITLALDVADAASSRSLLPSFIGFFLVQPAFSASSLVQS